MATQKVPHNLLLSMFTLAFSIWVKWNCHDVNNNFEISTLITNEQKNKSCKMYQRKESTRLHTTFQRPRKAPEGHNEQSTNISFLHSLQYHMVIWKDIQSKIGISSVIFVWIEFV